MVELLKKSLFFVLISFSVFNFACTRTNTEVIKVESGPGVEANANGTSDGGGGDIDRSTPVQVRQSILRIRGFLLKPQTLPRIQMMASEEEFREIEDLRGHQLSKNETLPFSYLGHTSSIFEPQKFGLALNPIRAEIAKIHMDSDLWKDDESKEKAKKRIEELAVRLEENAKKLPVNIQDYLPEEDEIKFIDDGPCPSSTTQHADASVSTYQYNAQVCFSLDQLRRLPPENLDTQIFGLWMHELLHMAGFKDELRAEIFEQLSVYLYPKLIEVNWQHPGRWLGEHIYEMDYRFKEIAEILNAIQAKTSVVEREEALSEKKELYLSILSSNGTSLYLFYRVYENASNFSAEHSELDEDRFSEERAIFEKASHTSGLLRNMQDTPLRLDTLDELLTMALKLEQESRELWEMYEKHWSEELIN